MALRVFLAAVLITVGGCAGSEDPDDAGVADTNTGTDAGPTDTSAPDGSTVDAGMVKPVALGVGQDMYMPVEDGAQVDLAFGTQGGGRFEGFHIVSAVRILGLIPTGIEVNWTLTTTTGVTLAEQGRVFGALEPNGDGFVAYGVAPRISDCCLAANKDVIMSVTARDTTGTEGSDQARVSVGSCIDPTNNRNFCP